MRGLATGLVTVSTLSILIGMGRIPGVRPFPGSSHSNTPWAKAFRATHIRGQSVEDRNGEYIGKVSGFILDLRTGRVGYALISYGGWLGIGKRQKAVPAPALSIATAKKHTVALAMSSDGWEKTPDFVGLSGLATVPSRNRNHQLQQRAPAPTGRVNDHQPRSDLRLKPDFRFASELSGATVLDPNQQTLGTLSDFLLDLTGQKPVLAILSSRVTGKLEKFTLPLQSLKPAGNDRLVLNARPERFEDALPLTPGAWDKAGAGAVWICRLADRRPHPATAQAPLAAHPGFAASTEFQK